MTPSGIMVSHVPRLPNNKITAAMFAQDQRSRWECVGDLNEERCKYAKDALAAFETRILYFMLYKLIAFVTS